ncbi:MAG: helix-turn-helix transcriptional regulator [Rhodopseudomonas sp.]|uniref:helix-turn-helix transcriptional regulator n=1 Tax=Rhodopseudomonas sp. TaxID=1078 RepID=UPI00180C6AEB|nr:helix-turn-helix transcriptional regulator [Rhodopseudomonas sp.]NVN85514.1 helix-turn-helix transcriptional regulator [Rhodopseudomonas sp.]
MGSRAGIDQFSSFVMELHQRSPTHDPVALFQWSLEELAESVDADCSWGGWADLHRGEVDLCASLSYNLPEDFDQFWSEIKHDDLLARDVMDTGCCAARYDRYGSRHTAGMVALSDRYRIDKMAVVIADQPNSPISLFMSAYRSGREADEIDAGEIAFLRGALDHVRYLVERGVNGRSGAANLLVNAQGRILNASPEALRLIGDRCRGWKADYLPAELNSPAARPGRHTLAEWQIVVDRTELAHRQGQPLFGIALRPAVLSDRLTPRERQIAEEIANGHTHKEIARLLGLSPATVRNHTQTILMKLGVHSKATLSKVLHGTEPA